MKPSIRCQSQKACSEPEPMWICSCLQKHLKERKAIMTGEAGENR